jgi:nucleotide-binding universal stress UspA family protein
MITDRHHPVPQEAADEPAHVLVVYDSSPHGEAALLYAEAVAGGVEAPLTVLAVAPIERVDVGCLRCRQSAAIWNHELAEIAAEELDDAAAKVGASCSVQFEVARGHQAKAIADGALRSGADLIVLPWRRPRRFGGRLRPDLAGRLRREGAWQVLVAPPAPSRSRPGRRVRSG